MAFKHCVTLSFDYDPEAVQESSKMLVLCSETDVDEPMRWKEYKPPAECPKTCSIVTNHFTAYALVIQKPVTAIMPAAVAAIVSAMLAVAWSGGTTEIVAVSAAAVGFLVALIYSALWSGATTMTAPMNESLPGLPPADCEWTEESKRWCSKLTNLKESENKLVCENENFLIDTGSSGTRVYVGFYSRLGKTVEEAAVKVVPTDGNKAKALTERNNEAKILLTKRHINIVDYYKLLKEAPGEDRIPQKLLKETPGEDRIPQKLLKETPGEDRIPQKLLKETPGEDRIPQTPPPPPNY
ncbi:hypothetical protein LSAT2_013929 [Lamellibrachia satsuma]|nr:hypothetical protein LSAT2_013929 [Lamellibrachia satsuma]